MNIFTLVAKLTLDSKEFKEGIEDSEKKSGSFGNALKTAAVVGVGAITAITSATVGLTKEFIRGVGELAAYGDNIDKMSQKMGLSAQAYQEWDAVMRHSGTSIDSLQMGMKTLANAVESGNDAFERLGISQEQIASMNQEELFSATITALQNVESETERTYLAGQLLGRGATELGALLNTSAEDTQAMKDRVHELGGVLSDEAVKASAAYQDSLQDMQTAMSGLKNNMFAEFLPSITTIMDGLTEVFGGDKQKGIGLIKEGLNSIPNIISSVMPDVLSNATEMITLLVETFVDSLPQFLDFGLQMLKRIMDGIQNNLPNVLSTVVSMLGKMLSTFVSHLPEFLALGVKLVASIITGIIQNIPNILSQIGSMAGQMIRSFLSYDWWSLGSNVISGIVSGIISAGGQLINVMVNLAKSAWRSVKNFFGISSPSKLMRDSIGKFIPKGMAVGIDANADEVYDAMDRLNKIAIDPFDDPLDINVPYVSSDRPVVSSGDSVIINVYPSAGMDEEAIARKVEEKLSEFERRRGAVYA